MPGAREVFRVAGLKPVELPADIQSLAHAGRQGLGEIRPQGVVGVALRAGEVELVVQHRQGRALVVDQHDRGAVRRDRDGVERLSFGHFAERGDDEGEEAIEVEMRVGPVAPHLVGDRADGDVAALVKIVQDDLGIGLSDIDHGDVAGGTIHALSPSGTWVRAA